MQLRVGQKDIGARYIKVRLEGNPEVMRQPAQVGGFVDDAPLDQDAVGASSDLPASRLRGRQQRRRQHLPQAIEFAGRAGFAAVLLVVI